jgi:hypothetical protein
MATVAIPAATPARQRVRDALAHRQPDRVPIDLGATAVTGIHVSVVAALRDYYALAPEPVKVHEPYQMLGRIEDDLAAALGLDVAGVSRRNTMFGFPNENWKPWSFSGLEVQVPEKFNVTLDANGDILIHPEGDLSAPPSGRMPKGGQFFDSIIRQSHFDEDNLNVEDNLEEFSELSDADVAVIAADAAEANTKGRAVIANFGGSGLGDIALVPAPFAKDPRGIRDVTEWYVSTRSRRGYVHQIFERQTEIAIRNFEKLYAAVGDTVEAVFLCGTDFGTQTSSFCSAPSFRELYLPYYKAMGDWIHRHTPWRVFKHSCGSVERFFESFIEAGIDIINPVQCSAAGMEPQSLKARYGDRLVFWGGGVDTQKTLPFGTPAQVREEVLRRCEIFAPGGGFVFNTVHNIQAGTPVENVVAMLSALAEYNGRK